jgi:hypothetical protein
MSVTPSPQEIAFAQKRMKLQEILSPCFVEQAQSPDFHAIEMSGEIATADGRGPRENTIKGQSLVTSARFITANGVSHQLALVIQHTDDWLPAVTVHTNQGGPVKTIIIRDGVDEAIPELKKMIGDAFDRARNS